VAIIALLAFDNHTLIASCEEDKALDSDSTERNILAPRAGLDRRNKMLPRPLVVEACATRDQVDDRKFEFNTSNTMFLTNSDSLSGAGHSIQHSISRSSCFN
jgi:hypothetical protein